MKINTKRNKNTNKKAIVLCGLLLLAFLVSTSISTASTTPLKPPVNPEFTAYKQKLVGGSYSFNNNVVKNGYIPAPFQLTVSKRSRASATAPSSYDLRTQNKLTPIKDQGRAGSCWAFATYGSLESFLMPLETQDFSENNMKNVLSDSNPDGFDRDESGGGNNYMATAYLARWSGPVGENDDKYSDVSIFNQNELGLPTKKHVQDVIFIPDTDSQGIKDAVQKYGAVYTHMYYTDSSYSPANRSYYYSGSASINHAVDIVGWDDAFDKNKFINVPSGNGAFIVRNSWGTDWGDKGFFYVSYYDSKIGSSNSVFTAEKTDNYKNVYQYDPLGLTDIIGYGGTTCWGANVFTAKSKEILKAVSFYATDVNCNYQISIYTDPVSGPTSQTPVLSQSGTISTAGYHTVPLNSGIQLNQSQKYSIVLKLTTSGVTYPLAIEEPVPMYSSKAKANPGESYISSDGTSWTDITTYFTNTNVCLKAFTNNLSPDDIHPALTIKKTASPNTYSATGQTIAYNYKVTNSGDVSVSGTVINDNKTSVTINNGPLAPGSSVQGTATYTIKQADMDAGSVTNTAKAIGTAGTQTVTSTPVTATVTKSNPPSLVITKVGNPITYKAVGKKIKYIYTVTNTGAVPVSGIVINDNKNAVTIKRGTLAPNSSIKGTATYTITQADMDAGSVTNTAKAIGTAGTQTVTSNEVKVTITKK